MVSDGWVKIHRKVLDNPIVCKDSDYLAVWVYLLLNATHKEYEVLFKGAKVTLGVGSLVTGRLKIAKTLNVNEYKVERILKCFENEHQIAQQTSNKNRIITVLNWNKYQIDAQQNEQQLHNNCTTTAHKQEYKEYRECKE